MHAALSQWEKDVLNEMYLFGFSCDFRGLHEQLVPKREHVQFPDGLHYDAGVSMERA